MGCCTSTFAPLRRNKLNLTLDKEFTIDTPADGELTPKRFGSKRSFSSRISSNSSSGVSSGCTTPSRRSIWSRNDSVNTSFHTPKPKPNNRNYNDTANSSTPPIKMDSINTKSYDLHSICDDFCEGLPEATPVSMDKSFGYYSESACTSSRSSTPFKTACNTHRTDDDDDDDDAYEDADADDHSELANSSMSTNPVMSDLEMEMYMMSQAQRLMPKTSSPICQRRDTTFEIVENPATIAAALKIVDVQTTSKSYNKWRNYLQTTPAHMLHNVTHIPEAIAGQFSPAAFPGYSDLEDMESAAKRYKVDVQTMQPTYATLQNGMAQMVLTHTISTEL